MVTRPPRSPTRYPSNALAVHTGAALLPTATWFVGEDEWGAHISPEVPVPESGTRAEKIKAMSQQMAHSWETAIAEHPQDWHMLQRVFTADLENPENHFPERRLADPLNPVPPPRGSAP